MSGLIAVGRVVVGVAEKWPPKASEVKYGDLEKVLIMQVVVIEGTWSKGLSIQDGIPNLFFVVPNIFGFDGDGPYRNGKGFVVV